MSTQSPVRSPNTGRHTGLRSTGCYFAAAGFSIPRTSGGQAGVGRVVTRPEVRAGDLIVYYSSRSHVAMAVDNARAVHASTEGQPVKIAPIDAIGPIATIRRIEG